mmetsp:Transcript_11894/g.46063  ORF Transcript_11894/g.46063 Transcript_11894/m.46063 type:complete len:139 (-) Transcript_11894:2778-3194(-)
MAATTSTRVPTRSHAARQAGGPAVSGSAGFSQGPEPSAPQVDVAKEGGKEGYVDPANSYFECNICLELAQEPIVTQCGHLYCWSCIYKFSLRRSSARCARRRSPRTWSYPCTGAGRASTRGVSRCWVWTFRRGRRVCG